MSRGKTSAKSKFAKSVRKIAKAVVHKAAENQIIVTALQATNPTIGPTAPQNVTAPNAAPGTGLFLDQDYLQEQLPPI